MSTNREGCDCTAGSGYCDPCQSAAAAAARVPDLPDYKIEGDLLGECRDCGNQFRYATPKTGIHNLDPCPDCGSDNWYKYGHAMPDGTVIPAEVNDD